MWLQGIQANMFQSYSGVGSQPLQAPPQSLQMTQTMTLQTGTQVNPASVAAATPQQLSAVVPATSVAAAQPHTQPAQGYYPQVFVLAMGM